MRNGGCPVSHAPHRNTAVPSSAAGSSTTNTSRSDHSPHSGHAMPATASAEAYATW